MRSFITIKHGSERSTIVLPWVAIKLATWPLQWIKALLFYRDKLNFRHLWQRLKWAQKTNLREQRLSKQLGSAYFAKTYFSFFGLINITERCSSGETEIVKKYGMDVYKATCGLARELGIPWFNGGMAHTLTEPTNFGKRKDSNTILLLDYGLERLEELLQLNKDKLFQIFENAQPRL